MSTLTTIRSLLSNLKRSKASSPDEAQLKQLHVEMCESDEMAAPIGLENIDTIGDFVSSEVCQAETRLMDAMLAGKESAQYNSGCISSLLASWIRPLARKVADVGYLHITNKSKLLIENDIYSQGVFSEMNISLPHKEKRICPFMSVTIREKHRPGPLLTSAELYSLLAMAAKHSTPLCTGTINVRLVIVYSCWVQVLIANTTPLYVLSLLEGRQNLVDKIEIHQTPWFNFFHPSSQLQLLLAVFEKLRLDLHKVFKMTPYQGIKSRMPLKDIQSHTESKRPKRKPKIREQLENKKQKS